MPAFVEDPDDEFDYVTDWKEVVGDSQPGGGTTLSNEVQDATLAGYVPWNMQRSAARFFLGFTDNDTNSPYKLLRENPHRHPIFPWLHAHSVTFGGVVIKANTANPNNSPWNESLFETDSYYTNYTHALATVKYRSNRHRFLPDEDITSAANEYKRNCLFRTAGRIEMLSADGISQLLFAETSATGPSIVPFSPSSSTAFPAPLGVLLPKASFAIDWLSLPFDYLSSDPDYFFPDKVYNCLGKVNSLAFLGSTLPSETCLMQPYEYTEFNFPVASDHVDNRPLRGIHLRLNFDYFEPTQGASVPLAAGHNTFPWRGDGKFYLATRSGAPAGTKLLEAADFNKIWEHVDAP